MTTKNRKAAISARCGKAKPTTRRTVSRESFWSTTDRSRRAEPSIAQGLIPLMASPSELSGPTTRQLRVCQPPPTRSRNRRSCAWRSASLCSSRSCPADPLQQGLGLADGPGVAGEDRLDQVGGGGIRALARHGCGGDAQVRASSTSTYLAVAQISIAREYPTSSTSGFVPARSGTRPSAGSFMQNFTSSATTRGRRRGRAGNQRRSRSRAPPQPRRSAGRRARRTHAGSRRSHPGSPRRRACISSGLTPPRPPPRG